MLKIVLVYPFIYLLRVLHTHNAPNYMATNIAVQELKTLNQGDAILQCTLKNDLNVSDIVLCICDYMCALGNCERTIQIETGRERERQKHPCEKNTLIGCLVHEP